MSKKFTAEHLTQVRSNFLGLTYEQQNVSLDGLLHRCQTKKSSGHRRKNFLATSSTDKRIGRPPAEESSFSFEYSLRNDCGINVHVCHAPKGILHCPWGLVQRDYRFYARRYEQDSSNLTDVESMGIMQLLVKN